MGIWSGGWTKHDIDFFVYFLETGDELSKSVDFGKKLRYFTDQNGPKDYMKRDYMKIKFEYFQI